ncbi:HNH endonuclease [Streptomyces sp. NPDC003343]
MTEGRPAIPAALRRAVLEEAGYACAVPTCRETTTEIAHIEPWAKVKEHTFDNLIALCPNHHTRYDQKKEIPKQSIRQYKANLAILSGRYGSLERQALEWLADDLARATVTVPRGMDWAFGSVLREGLFTIEEAPHTWGSLADGTMGLAYLTLTEQGTEVVRRIREGRPILDA